MLKKQLTFILYYYVIYLIFWVQNNLFYTLYIDAPLYGKM